MCPAQCMFYSCTYCCGFHQIHLWSISSPQQAPLPHGIRKTQPWQCLVSREDKMLTFELNLRRCPFVMRCNPLPFLVVKALSFVK